MPFQRFPLLVGVSARIYYPNTPVLDLGGVWTKTLHYLEQSVAQWLIRGGALPVMVPAVDAKSTMRRDELVVSHYAEMLDALVLQGGNDVAPQSYGETPLRPEWAGDPVRDRYEMELVEAFMASDKPVFGICRGMQLLNVKLGGSLWQDLQTQRQDVLRHVCTQHYEHNLHTLEVVPGTRLAELYQGCPGRQVNSIHHQAVKDLAPGLVVEARCPEDGTIEAVRLSGDRYVAAVQWHPEFRPVGDTAMFDDGPMLNDFLLAARRRKDRNGALNKL